MQVSLSASGTPEQILAAVNIDVRREAAAHPDEAGVLHVVRDYLVRQARAAGEDVVSTVTATVDLEVTAGTAGKAESASAA